MVKVILFLGVLSVRYEYIYMYIVHVVSKCRQSSMSPVVAHT